MKNTWKVLSEIIEESQSVVVFGGAGMSTESGIPDFRSEAGLYRANEEFGKSPEEMISHSFFMREPENFFKYYKNNMLYPNAQPNKAHVAIAKLEKEGKLKAVVTQNIDGLHQKAGSKTVYELHGSMLRNNCIKCGNFYDLEYIMDTANCKGSIPICSNCGGIVKPDVTLYEEALDGKAISGAVEAIRKADMLIVGGTSLVVYPAASFVEAFKGKNLVLINKGKVAKPLGGVLEIRDAIGEVLGAVVGV